MQDNIKDNIFIGTSSSKPGIVDAKNHIAINVEEKSTKESEKSRIRAYNKFFSIINNN